MKIVELVAVCGSPHAGKDTFVDALLEFYGKSATRVDDGLPLRRATAALFDIPLEDCLTQEGKAKALATPLGDETVRKAIGDMGKALETRYGEFCTPFLAMRSVEQARAANPDLKLFVFSSVRMRQPWFYRERGAVVIEVHRPGNEPSPYDFDQWDKNSVHLRIINNGTVEELRSIAQSVAFWLMGEVALAPAGGTPIDLHAHFPPSP